MITKEMIDELRRLEGEATPGPWTQWKDQDSVYAGEIELNTRGNIRGKDLSRVASFDSDEFGDDEDEGCEIARSNAAFCAAVRNAIIPLLDEIERLIRHNGG